MAAMDDHRKGEDRRTPTYEGELVRLQRMYAGANDRRKGGDRRVGSFHRKFLDAHSLLEKLFTEIECLLFTVNGDPDSIAAEFHYREIDRLASDLRELTSFLRSLIRSSDSKREGSLVRKRTALVNALDRWAEASTLAATNVYRPILEEESLKLATDENTDASTP